MKKFLMAAAIVAASSMPAFAAGNSATESGVATATVIAPITLTHTSGAALAFGKFTVGTGGTVAVSTSGVGGATGGVTLVSGSTNGADSFGVGGDAGRSFAITTGSGTVSAGAVSIPFTTTVSAPTGTLDSTGAASFTVGGTLTIAGTEPAGNYVGSYSATVTYN